MGAIGVLVGFALLVFQFVLIARLVLDWVVVLASGGGPPWSWRAREVTHRLTEPVIGPVRRVLKPVRVGSMSIDLAFTAVFIGVLILRSIVVSL